jgi:hypothetical protein
MLAQSEQETKRQIENNKSTHYFETVRNIFIKISCRMNGNKFILIIIY